MVTIDAFSRVVSEIYASSINPANWAVAMSEIARVTNATGCGLVMSSTGGRSVVLGSSMPVEAITSYRQYYHAIDHVLDTCEKSPPGLILGGQEVNAGKTRTEFHADWQKPFGLTDGLVVLVSTGQTSVSFAISAPRRNERFDSPERVRFVSALLRHLRQALRAQRHFAEFGAVTVDLMHVIDTFPSGIAIIDSAQAVVQLNAAAARILACGDGLRLRARTVEALRASTNTQLQTSIARALDAHPGGVRTGSTLVCSRPSGKRPYVLHVHPSPKPSDGDASSPKAILVIVDLDHEAKPSPVLLRSAFGLTNAEAMVALRALQGDGLKAIAQDLSLSRPTVATHLQHIYDKTGVRRQAELVRLLLALTTSPAP